LQTRTWCLSAPSARRTSCARAACACTASPAPRIHGEHLRWHHRAADLLGIERRYFGSDYIGQLISWRRSHLEGLQQHLEQTLQRPWHRGVARSLRVSEYILYGAYIDAVVGLADSGHYPVADDLCHCCWFRDEADALASRT
jgi:hypothetical protein